MQKIPLQGKLTQKPWIGKECRWGWKIERERRGKKPACHKYVNIFLRKYTHVDSFRQTWHLIVTWSGIAGKYSNIFFFHKNTWTDDMCGTRFQKWNWLCQVICLLTSCWGNAVSQRLMQCTATATNCNKLDTSVWSDPFIFRRWYYDSFFEWSASLGLTHLNKHGLALRKKCNGNCLTQHVFIHSS